MKELDKIDPFEAAGAAFEGFLGATEEYQGGAQAMLIGVSNELEPNVFTKKGVSTLVTSGTMDYAAMRNTIFSAEAISTLTVSYGGTRNLPVQAQGRAAGSLASLIISTLSTQLWLQYTYGTE